MPALAFLSDPLFWTVALAAFAAATVRGFSGFGAGMVFMPIAAACLGPKQAAGILFVVDLALIAPFVIRAVPVVEWREIVPLGVGAAIMVPLGVLILLRFGALQVRWSMSAMILGSVALLATGVRYRGRTRAWLSVLVGGVSGLMGGVAQLSGPPVVIYWLGRAVAPAVMRANAIVFFCFTTAVGGVAYFMGGIFTADVMLKSALLIPVYGAGMLFGSRLFGLASEATYRRIAYALIIAVAVLTLPLFG